MGYVMGPSQALDRTRVGGKARALAALDGSGLEIPAWFVITADAADLSEPRNPSPRSGVREEIERALTALQPPGERVAVRSSAVDEDGTAYSFAGQLESFLSVPVEQVLDRVVAVWRSAFGDRAASYRRQNRLARPEVPAVIVQRLIAAEASGVAFSADPVTGSRREAIVTAIFGLGAPLVSGEVDGDTYRVSPAGEIVARHVTRKDFRSDPNPDGGVRQIPVPGPQAQEPVLRVGQVRAVATMARRAEEIFGTPQDVEWAIEGGHLYLLQSRPITALGGASKTAANLWDNSNIAESYSGVTTPLTFSFARQAYEDVYQQLCRLMKIPASTVAAHREDFRRMIGLIQGRVYYNLFSWYRLLAMVPGFGTNRQFMEQMMGVRETMPDDVLERLSDHRRWRRLLTALPLTRTMSLLLLNHLLFSRRMVRFSARLDQILGTGRPDFGSLRPNELVAYYRRLERELITKWDVPLINDFLAMIFFGLLGKLTASWCGDSGGTLRNELLQQGGGVISTEPATRVRKLADVAARHPSLMRALSSASAETLEAEIGAVPEFAALYKVYLEKFGERCLEELKLESPTLHDDPLPLLRSIGRLADSIRTETGVDEASTPMIGEAPRRAAEARVRRALRLHPFRRIAFAWVLKNARARVRDRENLRFERTRVFGRVRQVFAALGSTFHALGLLDDPRDIFYLEAEEILGFVEGTTTSTDLKGLALVRRAEFERYGSMAPPDDRFVTKGAVHIGNSFKSETAEEKLDVALLHGLGACSGTVSGPIRLVTNPRENGLRPGDILVAERTDPGWVPLFASAAGIITERGSLLSHAAIVAREMGIPTIVSAAGITDWVRDGEWVEMDGATGVVRKIDPHSLEAPERSRG